MTPTFSSAVRRVGSALVVFVGISVTGPAHADYQAPRSLPVFVPHPSDWQPNYSVYPYNIWQNRVTPEQITAELESCQWFNAQYGELMGQVLGFQHFLGDQRDTWTAPGVQASGDVVAANLDQSAAFLDPRVHTLYVANYDTSHSSPLYNGDSFYHLWYQFTQISDKLKQKMVSGVVNANISIGNVYGNTIRDSGVCDGA